MKTAGRASAAPLLTRILPTVIGALLAGAALGAEWPNGPFTTSGSLILDADGLTVQYAGINWPAAAETMLPEGLQYQSIEAIVSRLKGVGINSIRLTYAIQMVDDILDHDDDDEDQDVTLQKALTQALGAQDGGAVYRQILERNPGFDDTTTRLQVLDAVADECARQQIYVHLDNHVSKAGWCCNPTDGNSWWGDTHFDTDKWLRGLSYMAEHGKRWPNLMSMSLRNELRQTLNDLDLWRDSYNWRDWYAHVRRGADAVHAANPGVLVFLSGLESDTNLTAVVEGSPLGPGPDDAPVFNPADFAGYADKLVLELHAYDNILGPAPPCDEVRRLLYRRGFETLDSTAATNRLPLVLTEFGLPQDGSAADDPYAACLMDYLAEQRAGWMIWVLAGSYYTREGARDADEPWGLLSHDWSAWRAPSFVADRLVPLVNATVEAVGKDPDSLPGNPGSSGGGGGGGGEGDEGGDGSSSAAAAASSSRPAGALAMLCGGILAASVFWR